MDYHLLALIEQSEDSDFSSDTKFPTVISGFSEIQSRGSLVDQAKFKDRPNRPGIIWSGRLTGNPENLGFIPVETTTQTPTTDSVVSQPLITEARGVAQPSLGAVPRSHVQPKAPKTNKVAPKAPTKSKAPTTPFQGDLEFEDLYAEDQNQRKLLHS